MKDFSPHAILRSPLTPDRAVEALINLSLIYSGGAGPVTLLIDPCSPIQRGEPLPLRSWRGSATPEAQTPR